MNDSSTQLSAQLVPDSADAIKSLVTKEAQAWLKQSGAVGLVIGVVFGDHKEILSFGKFSRHAQFAPDEKTIFEIGSITKVFTTIALSDLAGERKLFLADPVERYLPAEVTMPKAGGVDITLRHLATHTSRLPRLPDNFDQTVTEEENPYRDYKLQHLYEYLASAKLYGPPSSIENYSNLGVGLLGQVVGQADGKGLEREIRERICEPLGMTDTSFTLNAEQQRRFAPAHTKDREVSHWDFDALIGAGGLRSTGADMLKFLEANLGRSSGKIQHSLDACQEFEGGRSKLLSKSVRLAAPVLLLILCLLAQWIFALRPGSWGFAVAVFSAVIATCVVSGTRLGCVISFALLVGSFGLWREFGAGWIVTLGICAAIAPLFGELQIGKALPPLLGWQALRTGVDIALWHNGMVGGMASFVGFIREKQVGVFLLANSALDLDETGMRILDGMTKTRGNAG